MWKVAGRRWETGLGSGRDGSLPRARGVAGGRREVRAECGRMLAAGRDPLEARATAKTAERVIPTFGECADEFVAAKQSEWRNDKHRAQWAMMLKEYAAPLRKLPIDVIDTAAVLSVLKPIWQAKPERPRKPRSPTSSATRQYVRTSAGMHWKSAER